jgi:hypothetical protein
MEDRLSGFAGRLISKNDSPEPAPVERTIGGQDLGPKMLHKLR